MNLIFCLLISFISCMTTIKLGGAQGAGTWKVSFYLADTPKATLFIDTSYPPLNTNSCTSDCCNYAMQTAQTDGRSCVSLGLVDNAKSALDAANEWVSYQSINLENVNQASWSIWLNFHF